MKRDVIWLKLLNYEALEKANIYTEPFKWACINKSFISEEQAKNLCLKFPIENFKHNQKHNSDKNYNMYNIPLVEKNNIVLDRDNIDDVWIDLAKELLSNTYRENIGKIVKECLLNSKVFIIFWKYEKGCWLDAHLDKKEKLVTQIFYFNEVWESAWGGNLLILNSKDINDIAYKVPSEINSSAIIYRDENSWHAVEKVSELAKDFRKSLQVIFYKN